MDWPSALSGAGIVFIASCDLVHAKASGRRPRWIAMGIAMALGAAVVVLAVTTKG